jgi:hypothetical protein
LRVMENPSALTRGLQRAGLQRAGMQREVLKSMVFAASADRKT